MRSFLVHGVLSLLAGAGLIACGGGSDNGGDDDGTGKTPDAAPAGTIDAGPPAPDARTDRFRCIGTALPTTGPASVTIGGKVNALGGAQASPVKDATVAMVKRSGGDMASGKSAADGAFSFSASSGGNKPIDAYLKITAATYNDTEVYPPVPWVGDAKNLNVVVLKPAQIALIGTQVKPKAISRQAGTGVLTVAVQDCDQMPVAGAKVAVTANGKAVGTLAYIVGNNVIDTSATGTGDTGVAIIFNVPPGSVDVAATTSDNQTLRAHTIEARADVATATSVLP